MIRLTRRLSHFDNHRQAYRPDVKTCTFKVSRHDSSKKVVAKAERMKGVMETKWNPRTRELACLLRCKSDNSPSYHAPHGMILDTN